MVSFFLRMLKCLERNQFTALATCGILVHVLQLFCYGYALVSYLFPFLLFCLIFELCIRVWFYARFSTSLVPYDLKLVADLVFNRLIYVFKMRFLFSSILLILCSFRITSAGHLKQIAARTISPDNTCGRNGTGGGADGYSCPMSLPCCSTHGFCGSTNEYCLTTVGCQAAFGNCTAPSPGTISPDETCGITGAGTAGYTCSADSPCCSGKLVASSTPLNLLKRVRTTDKIVSGWCGNTTDYCNESVGCQSAYGTCINDTTTSTSPGTGGTSTNGQCGPGFGTCASNECCSLAGFWYVFS
jgi:hypothetical protein